MAVYNAWVVEYYDGSAWTAIPKVQDLSCQVGRQTAVDQWPVSQASMRIWYPNGYTTPLANLTIGTYIRFFAPGRSSTKPSWTGLVQNVTVEVGIPWNSGTSTGNGDFLVIDCEGALGKIGRMDETVMRTASTSPTSVYDLIVNGIFGETRGPVYTDTGVVGTSIKWNPDGTTYREQPIVALNQTAVYSLNRLCDGVAKKSTWFSGGGYSDGDPFVWVGTATGYTTIATVGFSDTMNNATNRIYDTVAFDGLADQYFTQSQLTRTNFSLGTTNTVTTSVGSAPYRTFATDVLPNSGTLADAYMASLGEYWANAFNPPDIGISSISATTANQHTQNLDTLGVTDLELGYLPLYVVPVTLRGTTYYCQIEGVAITADTNQTRFTYYVTPTDTTAWFTLDSSTFGVLDQNRLGIY